MTFPTSPSNGDIHIKGDIRYQYVSASNSWERFPDPNLVAENIKDGVTINGVLGTLASAGITGNNQGTQVNISGSNVEVFQAGKVCIVGDVNGFLVGDSRVDSASFGGLRQTAEAIAIAMGETCTGIVYMGISDSQVDNYARYDTPTWDFDNNGSTDFILVAFGIA